MIDTAFGYLDDLNDRSIGQTPQEVLMEVAEIINDAYKHLSDMAGVGQQDLAYQLVPALQRWFTSVGAANTIFFRAKLEENYEIYWYDPDDLPHKKRSQTLERAIADITWDFARVTVPSKAFSYLPHMAIVAHEIGHAIYKSIPVSVPDIAQERMIGAVRRRLSKNGMPFTTETEKLIGEIRDDWLEELTADAVSYFLAGPAAFFALSEFLGFFGKEYGFNQKYPPHSVRRGILFRQLQTDGFVAVFEEHTSQVITEDFNSALMKVTPTADALFEAEKEFFGTRSAERAAIFSELPTQILDLVPWIYENVGQHLTRVAPKQLYTASRLDDDLDKHLQPLLMALPPIETDGPRSPKRVVTEREIDLKLTNKVPVEFASILNIGWAALLTKHTELKIKPSGSSDEDCERLESIHGLLLKAVELSEALRSWKHFEVDDGSTVGI
ncbi:hypothetical protein ACQR1Y_18890 [Bradyrhizobium sp. HKCCYLRH3099]|uniref:hypothetical protein n=1 Tax=unclassified Bradyrhizobium TaxID=2631580 RepID=UPI003EBA44E0